VTLPVSNRVAVSTYGAAEWKVDDTGDVGMFGRAIFSVPYKGTKV
jgi:hypothetical protein